MMICELQCQKRLQSGEWAPYACFHPSPQSLSMVLVLSPTPYCPILSNWQVSHEGFLICMGTFTLYYIVL